MSTREHGSRHHVVLAGLVAGVVGYASSFAVVLAGLLAVGATPDQAASGLLAVTVSMGIGSVLFSFVTRQPVTFAWSTPGAALLAAAAVPVGGFPAAVGAFLLASALVVLCGAVRPLARAVAAVPPALAAAMFAGLLLPLCLAPARALTTSPTEVAVVIAAWVACLAFARRWAVIAALVATIAVLTASGAFQDATDALVPPVELVAPTFEPAALIGLGLPLLVATMVSQQVPAVAVLRGCGYHPDVSRLLVYAGGTSVLGAFAGGQVINVGAIPAALAAGPDVHPDPGRRWPAGVVCGLTYLAIAPCTGVVAAVAHAAPPGVVPTLAGLSLLATFTGTLTTALGDGRWREAAVVTFLISASGITLAGIGGAVWGLVAGLGFGYVVRGRTPAEGA